MSKQSASIVAIVGRANVGKSSLFNALLGRRETIVAKEPGTTRDSISARASWNGKDFWLVDTAGLKQPEDEFELSINQQILEAAQSADLIVVVVEAGVGLSDEDRRLAKLAHKTKAKVLLAINKIDKSGGVDLEEWNKLGIKDVVGTSTTQRKGIEELAQTISASVVKAKIPESKNRIRLALVGRPNVGKSSLFNSLANKQQAVVAKQAGTTRDVNRTVVRYHSYELEFMDTAGIRRKGRTERGVESFSILRSLAAIEQSDISLLVVDSTEASVQLDQKLAGIIKEAGRGLIVVLSKSDLIEKVDSTKNELLNSVRRDFVFVPWAPAVITSSETGENVTKLFELSLALAQARRATFKTTELNRWLKSVTEQHPPAGLKGRLPKLNYIAQESEVDFPNFKIFGAHTKFLHWSYKRYLERKFREIWPLAGTPIKFWFIEKH